MIDEKAFYDEFTYCLRKRDGIKLTLVLEVLPDVSPEMYRKVIQELTESHEEISVMSIAEFQKRKPEVFARLPDLNVAYESMLVEFPHEIVRQINDERIMEKSAALKAVRHLQLKDAVGYVEEQLHMHNDSSWAKEAIETLGEFGMQSSVSVLSGFLYVKDRSLVASAVRALANIATPSAIERLAESTGRDAGRDVLVVREFARLQLPLTIEKMVKMLCSHHTQLRNFAKEKVADIGSKAVPFLEDVLQSGDADWTVHALNLLGEIHDQTAGAAIRKLLQRGPENANVRFAAYEALEVINVTAGGYTLTEGLLDNDEQVAFAAARAINANLNDSMINGLRSLVASGSAEREGYLMTLLKAEADNVMKALVSDGEIRGVAADLLNSSAITDDTHRRYKKIFKECGYDDLVESLGKRRYGKKSSEKEIWVVDDSPTVLSLYKNALSGLDCILRQFDGGEAVVDEIHERKPDVLFTDLNMPGMTGIELVGRLRKRYSKEQLPVILVTTQSDVRNDSAFDHEDINELIEKPFTAKSIVQTAERYLQT